MNITDYMGQLQQFERQDVGNGYPGGKSRLFYQVHLSLIKDILYSEITVYPNPNFFSIEVRLHCFLNKNITFRTYENRIKS